MRAARIAFWALLVTLLGVASALAYLPVYLEAHKELLAVGASRMLGRPVRIGGAVGLGWLPRPSLTLEDVEIAGTEGWADPPWRIGRLEADLDLAALSDRQLRIGRLLMRESAIAIDLGRIGDAGPSQLSISHGGFRFGVGSFRLMESTLVVRSHQGQARTFRVQRLDLQGLGSPSLVLAGEGSESGTPLAISLSTGPPGESGSRRWPFDARVRVADASLEASGSTAVPFDFAQIESDLSVSGPDLQALQGLVPGLALPAGAFRVTGRLNRGQDGLELGAIEGSLDAAEPLGRITLSEATFRYAASALTADLAGRLQQTPFRLELGLSGMDRQASGPPGDWSARLEIAGALDETRLLGDLVLASSGPRPRIKGSLDIEQVDLRSPGTFKRSATKPPGAGTWPDIPLPVDSLSEVDLELALQVRDLDAGRLTVERIATRVTLEDGLLRLDSLRIAWPGMGLAGEVMLDARAGRPVVTAALKANRIALPDAVTFLVSEPRLSGSLDEVSLTAKAQGTSARALLETLDGELRAREARFQAKAAAGPGAGEIRLIQPRLTVGSGAPVRLQAAVNAEGQAFDLGLTGGSLEALLSHDAGWSKLGVLAQRDPTAGGPEIRGSVGPLAAVLAGRDLHLDLSLQQPGLKIGATGRLARLDGLQGSTLAVEAAVEDHSVLGNLLGFPLGDRFDARFAGGPPLKVSGRLVGLDQGLELRDLKAISGDSDLDGGMMILRAPKPRIEATLRSRMLDLTPYLVSGASGGGSAREASWRAPPPEILETLDGTLRLTTGRLRAGDLGLDMVDLSAVVDSGHLRASLAAGAERLSADIDLRPVDGGWRFDIHSRGNLDLSWLLMAERATALSHLPTKLDARLTGVATSFEALLGHAGGHLELALGPGRLNRKAADLLPLGGLVESLLDAINPLGHRRDFNDLQCAVLQFDLADGIATSTRGLAVQTRDINAIGGGALNLRTGEIEIRFKTVRRRGTGISLLGIADRFVHIKGTLRDPKAGIDPGALLVHGAAAWATTGISLLADQLFRRLTGATNPCDVVRGRR